MAPKEQTAQQISKKTFRTLLALGSLLVIGWSFVWGWLDPSLDFPQLSFQIIGAAIMGGYILARFTKYFEKKVYKLIVLSIWAIVGHSLYFCYINNFHHHTVLGLFISLASVSLCFATMKSYIPFCVTVMAACIALPLIGGSKTNPYLLAIGISTFQLVGFWMIASRAQFIQSMRKSARDFDSLFNAMPAGGIIFEDGNISRISRDLPKITGTSDVRYVDTLEELAVAMDLEASTGLRKILNNKDSRSVEEVVLRTKDGARAFSFRRLPFKDSVSSIKLLCIEDVTAEDALRNRVNDLSAHLTTAERVFDQSRVELKAVNSEIKKSLFVMRKGTSDADKVARMNALKEIMNQSRKVDAEMRKLDAYFVVSKEDSDAA